MNLNHKAKKILGLIFNESSEKECFQGTSHLCYHQYFVIPGKENLRWIVPVESELGVPILSQWRPYDLQSYIKWKFLLFLYSKGLLKTVPGIKTLEFSSDKINIPWKDTQQKLIPIIYVGTPGSHQKAVATLVDSTCGKPVGVMKVALKKSAFDKLQRESDMLKKLADLKIPGIPRVIAYENNDFRTIQTVISGPLTSRKLTQAHINWLLKMPKSGKKTTFDEQREYIQETFEKRLNFPEKEKDSILHAISTLNGKHSIPYLLCHGDFAPWNLKWKTKGEITAIDWEDSSLNGIPLWDLSHFFCIQAHLFGGKNPFHMLSTCVLTTRYLKAIGLSNTDLRPLYMLYLLKKYIDMGFSSTESYSSFLLKQINEIYHS